MTSQQIADKVALLVAEKLPAALLVAGIQQHAKHGFKANCNCSYCNEKVKLKHCYTRIVKYNDFETIKCVKYKLANLIKETVL